MFKIFFLILHSKIRYGELVGEFDIIIRFVLAFEVLESIDYFGFLYDLKRSSEKTSASLKKLIDRLSMSIWSARGTSFS